MRDLFVVGIVLASLPITLIRPWVGVLAWTWLSLMSPHRYCWGFATTFPVAELVAIATLVGCLSTADRQPIPRVWQVGVLVCLWSLFGITTTVAFNPDPAFYQLIEVSKVLVMTFATVVLINDRRKLFYWVVVIALSLGLVGLKGGIFTLLTGGQHRVYGPPGTFIGDNNDAALALCMTLPFLYFLPRLVRGLDLGRWWAWLGRAAPVLTLFTAIAVVGTYSRGGFITLAVVLVALTWRSRYRVVVAGVMVIAVVVGAGMVTIQWKARMGTIETAEEEDSSFRGRLGAWEGARNIARARPFTGGGFHAFQGWVWDAYFPPEGQGHDVHSVYFEMLGEQGYPGFALFVLLLGGSFLQAESLRRRARAQGNVEVETYGAIIQIALAAYAVGGAALGKAYWDYFYDLIILLVLVHTLLPLAADGPAADEAGVAGVAAATVARWRPPERPRGGSPPPPPRVARWAVGSPRRGA